MSHLSHIKALESESIFIIRETFAKFKNPAMLWSIGKDSTTLLWLCYKAFFGKIPFPLLHIDTSYKFPEIYTFREKYAKEYGFDLKIIRNEEALAAGMNKEMGTFNCCNALKTAVLKDSINDSKYDAVLLGIRRDEHGIRAKERVFSPRDKEFKWDYENQDPELWNQYKSQAEEHQHLRVHPILGWREIDIWEYIKMENLPVCELYFSKKGFRYRSIGCSPCCAPVKSDADDIDKIITELQTTTVSERSGRSQDKEENYNMQKLRSLGYM